MTKFRYQIGAVVTGGIPKARIPDGSRWEAYVVEGGKIRSYKLVDIGRELEEGPENFGGRVFESTTRFVPPTYAARASGAMDEKVDKERG
jgi:hypothetical protein